MPEQILTSPESSQPGHHHQSYLLTGTLVNLMRKRFAQTQQLPTSIQHLVYSSDETLSTLAIKSRDDILGHNWQQRPTIVVRRNSLKSQRIGIGEGRLSSFTSSPVAEHNTLYVGSHTVLCCSTREAESELIAFEAQMYLNRFQHQIRHGLCMLRMRVNDVGQTGILRESRDIFATPFTIGYGYDQPFVVYPIAPAVRFLNVNTSTR